MILLRMIVAFALTVGAVWYFYADPERQAEYAAAERRLHFEATLRQEALGAIMERFQQAAVLIARTQQVGALVTDDKQEPAEPETNSPFTTVTSSAPAADDDMTDEKAMEDLLALESLTGLANIRVLRRNAAMMLPDVARPQELLDDGTWDAGVQAAFQGRLGRASYTDADGNPVYVFFTPIFGETNIPGILISDAQLRGEKARWETSQFRVSVQGDDGKVIIANSSRMADDVIEMVHRMPALNANLVAWSPAPDLIGPWAIRSAAIVIIAMLLLFLLEQQIARRRVMAQLAEARHFKAVRLEEEAMETATELDQVKDQLAVSESMALVGQVSASIGQEINQPLSAIKNYAEAAARFIDKGNTDLAQQNIRNVSTLTDRISRIIANIRGFSTAEPYQIEPVSVRPLVHDAAINMLDRNPAIGEYFFMEVAEDVPEAAFVRADRVRLGQVIANVLSSSWDACREEDQPELVISVQQSRNAMTIAVEHNGPAARNQSGRVNVGSAGSDGAGQSGAGFTIAKSFVEGMNGEMVHKTTALGTTRTEIILPKYGNNAT